MLLSVSQNGSGRDASRVAALCARFLSVSPLFPSLFLFEGEASGGMRVLEDRSMRDISSLVWGLLGETREREKGEESYQCEWEWKSVSVRLFSSLIPFGRQEGAIIVLLPCCYYGCVEGMKRSLHRGK